MQCSAASKRLAVIEQDQGFSSEEEEDPHQEEKPNKAPKPPTLTSGPKTRSQTKIQQQRTLTEGQGGAMKDLDTIEKVLRLKRPTETIRD